MIPVTGFEMVEGILFCHEKNTIIFNLQVILIGFQKFSLFWKPCDVELDRTHNLTIKPFEKALCNGSYTWTEVNDFFRVFIVDITSWV